MDSVAVIGFLKTEAIPGAAAAPATSPPTSHSYISPFLLYCHILYCSVFCNLLNQYYSEQDIFILVFYP